MATRPTCGQYLCYCWHALLGVSQKGSPERCRFRFFLFFFRFLPFFSVFSVFFRFFRFFPFFRFLLFFSISFSEKKNGEIPFARPLLRNPDFAQLYSKNGPPKLHLIWVQISLLCFPLNLHVPLETGQKAYLPIHTAPKPFAAERPNG